MAVFESTLMLQSLDMLKAGLSVCLLLELLGTLEMLMAFTASYTVSDVATYQCAMLKVLCCKAAVMTCWLPLSRSSGQRFARALCTALCCAVLRESWISSFLVLACLRL